MDSLLKICKAVKNGKMSLDEAANHFGISTRDMKARVTKWGDRLELLAETLDLIKDDKITRSEAAERLGTGVRNVNALMDRWHVQRPINPRLIQSATAEVKWEIRKTASLNYIRGSDNLADAAAKAEVSERQVRRWVSELLLKHLGMTWGEMQDLPLNKRFRIAQEIEKAEGIESATKRVIEAITVGKHSIADEVQARIKDRVRRKFPSST